MHRIPVNKLRFSLDALHVSDYISPSSGATFYKLYIVICISQTYRYIPAYTKCDVQLIKGCY